MARKILNLSYFAGGMATGSKRGIEGSFRYARSVDFRKDPNGLTVLPKTAKDSGATVDTLVTDVAQVPFNSGDKYFVGETKLYKRTGAGVWSVISSALTAGKSLAYRPDQDAIYITDSTTVHRYFPISNSPSMSLSKYTATSDQTLTGGANTYTLTTAVAEGATHKQQFTPTCEPLYSVKLKVVAKGTGNWTVTVHDDANNVIGTSTVTNANLTNGQLNEFVLSTAGRMLVKPNARTYHIHVHSTVADGTVQTATAADFETADFEEHASRLVASAFHPIALYQQYVCIGNERYLSVWEPLSDSPTNSEWLRHRLTFPSNCEVVSIAGYDEYLAIACRRNTASTTTGQGGDGIVFFWDGTSQTYNYFLEIPEGAPYSIFSHKRVLYWFAGGSWWAYAGGQPKKLRQMPNTDTEYGDVNTYSINYPSMMTVRNGILLAGFPSETTNTGVEHGVYSYGLRDEDSETSFGFSYPISTGTLTNSGGNLRLSMVRNFGDELYIAWRDAATYGVDVVSPTSDPSATASFESLIFDNRTPWKDKEAGQLKLTFETLPANSSVTLKYKINRASNWTLGTAVTSGTEANLNFPAARQFREIEFGFDVACTGTTTPKFTSISLDFDDRNEEKRHG